MSQSSVSKPVTVETNCEAARLAADLGSAWRHHDQMSQCEADSRHAWQADRKLLKYDARDASRHLWDRVERLCADLGDVEAHSPVGALAQALVAANAIRTIHDSDRDLEMDADLRLFFRSIGQVIDYLERQAGVTAEDAGLGWLKPPAPLAALPALIDAAAKLRASMEKTG